MPRVPRGTHTPSLDPTTWLRARARPRGSRMAGSRVRCRTSDRGAFRGDVRRIDVLRGERHTQLIERAAGEAERPRAHAVQRFRLRVRPLQREADRPVSALPSARPQSATVVAEIHAGSWARLGGSMKRGESRSRAARSAAETRVRGCDPAREPRHLREVDARPAKLRRRHEREVRRICTSAVLSSPLTVLLPSAGRRIGRACASCASALSVTEMATADVAAASARRR